MRRLVAWLAAMASFFLFDRMEIVGRSRLPRHRPVVLVANHFNGFVDPVVLARVLGRLPRFVAKATLRKVPGVGPLLQACGVVFVQRQADGPDAAVNQSAFTQCHAALRRADIIAIFPEGTTHDRPHLDPIRTGAARIVLGTDTSEPPLVVPVGLTYPDKFANRSTVLVEFGAPIDPRDVVPGATGEDDREAVDRLTERIEEDLRAVCPDFASVEDWLTFDAAATVAARGVGGPAPTLAHRAHLSRAIAASDDTRQDAIRRAMGRYAALLAPLRLTDEDVVDPTRSTAVLRRAIVAGIWVAIAGALVVATALVNVVPFALVIVAGLVTRTPVTKGTVRVLVGLVAFPLAWLIGALLGADGWPAVPSLFFVLALGAGAVIVLVDRALALGRSLVTWYVVRERAAAIEIAREVRQPVIDAVTAIGAVAAPTVERRWGDRVPRRLRRAGSARPTPAP